MIHMYSLQLTMFYFFFFNDPATTEIYTLSLHDALPISAGERRTRSCAAAIPARKRADGAADLHGLSAEPALLDQGPRADRKSTRLNSSHMSISYAVFCLKKKKKKIYKHINTKKHNMYVL